jgi:hypothetical protein
MRHQVWPLWLSGDSSGLVNRNTNTVGSNPTGGTKFQEVYVKNKPKVGDVVCLNDYGLSRLKLNNWSEIRQAGRMTVVWVDESSLTEPEETYAVDVDQPAINKFLLDHTMIDLLC